VAGDEVNYSVEKVEVGHAFPRPQIVGPTPPVCHLGRACAKFSNLGVGDEGKAPGRFRRSKL
jgi:hypothetical protein